MKVKITIPEDGRQFQAFAGRELIAFIKEGYQLTASKSLEQGRERYKEVRALVDEHLSPETPVILKRYCTEYEIGPFGQGASDELPEQTKEDLEFEAYVLQHFPPVGFGTKQPDYLTASVMVDWIHHAYMHGDPTYAEFTDGSPLFKPVVTYHDKVDVSLDFEKRVNCNCWTPEHPNYHLDPHPLPPSWECPVHGKMESK